MKNAILNWSGGKDSSITLHSLIQSQEYKIHWLLTTVSSQYDRISMHGVRSDLLEKQAKSIGIPLYKLVVPEMPSMEVYDDMMAKTLGGFKKEGIDYSIFGDIFLEDLKDYREKQLKRVNIQGVFPIWKMDTKDLVKDFIKQGFKSVLVCVNERYLDKSWSGRIIDQSFLDDLPGGVDPCGENGEFHTFVYDGPIFKHPIKFELGEIVHRTYKKKACSVSANEGSYHSNCDYNYDTGFWYQDLI